MAPTIILISGANRGLGKGLVAAYLSQPNHIVIAANRDPSHSTSKSLQDLPKGDGSKLIVVKIDAQSESDPAAAVKQLEGQGINHVDIVIANSGIGKVYPTVGDLKISDLREHTVVNVHAVVLLYQATAPLLRKSANPKWMTMGSTAGCIEHQLPVPNAAYGPTKAMVHWLTTRINNEEEKITAFVMHPGWVQTDTGNFSAQCFGLQEAPLSIPESIKGMVKVIDAATKESKGGKLVDYEGKDIAW